MVCTNASASLATSSSEVEFVACDLCGADDAREVLCTDDRVWHWHTSEPYRGAPSRRWQLVECRNCGLVYLNPRPTRHRLGDYYPQSYYAYSATPRPQPAGWKPLLKRVARRNRAAWELMKRAVPGGVSDPVEEAIGFTPVGTVLDVGCGAGAYLDAAAAVGWETSGVEFSAAAVEVARRKGHRVWEGDFTECDVPAQVFDVINMSHVLEHTPRPTDVLRAARRALKPGGVLIVDVPNFGSIWSSLFAEHSVALDLPRHLYHFRSGTLSELADRAGLRVRSCCSIASPRYLLASFYLLYCDHARAARMFDARTFFTSASLMRSLRPFCDAIERAGEGNHLRLIASPGDA